MSLYDIKSMLTKSMHYYISFHCTLSKIGLSIQCCNLKECDIKFYFSIFNVKSGTPCNFIKCNIYHIAILIKFIIELCYVFVVHIENILAVCQCQFAVQ